MSQEGFPSEGNDFFTELAAKDAVWQGCSSLDRGVYCTGLVDGCLLGTRYVAFFRPWWSTFRHTNSRSSRTGRMYTLQEAVRQKALNRRPPRDDNGGAFAIERASYARQPRIVISPATDCGADEKAVTYIWVTEIRSPAVCHQPAVHARPLSNRTTVQSGRVESAEIAGGIAANRRLAHPGFLSTQRTGE